MARRRRINRDLCVHQDHLSPGSRRSECRGWSTITATWPPSTLPISWDRRHTTVARDERPVIGRPASLHLPTATPPARRAQPPPSHPASSSPAPRKAKPSGPWCSSPPPRSVRPPATPGLPRSISTHQGVEELGVSSATYCFSRWFWPSAAPDPETMCRRSPWCSSSSTPCLPAIR